MSETMTVDPRLTAIEASIAAFERAGQPWTNRSVIEASGTSKRFAEAYLKTRRRQQRAAVDAPAPAPAVSVAEVPAPPAAPAPLCAQLRDRWQAAERARWTTTGPARDQAFVAYDMAERAYQQGCASATALCCRIRSDRKEGRRPNPELLARLHTLVPPAEATVGITQEGPMPWWYNGNAWPRQPASRA